MIQVLQYREMNEVRKGLSNYLLHAGNRFQASLLQLGGGDGIFFFFKAEFGAGWGGRLGDVWKEEQNQAQQICL